MAERRGEGAIDDLPDLGGTRALVTGGGTGIGRACAFALARAGAEVTILGPDAEPLQAAAAEIAEISDGAGVRAVVGDVTIEEQIAAGVVAAADGGALDIVVANAGTGMPGSLLHLGTEEWMVPIGINVIGTALTIKHAAPVMKAHGGGSIITMSSVASTRVVRFMGAYSVSKAAVDELTRVAANELGEFGIRVNGIRPGWINSDAALGAASDAVLAHAERETVLGRLGEPDDVARAVLYLASNRSEWVTGQLLGVCGGFSLVPPSMDAEHLARMLYPEQMAADFGDG